MNERRFRTTACLVAAAALGIAAAVPRAAAADAKKAPHGALAFAEQEKRLDRLLGERDVAKPPPGIDPVIWATLVPEDNEMTAERVALGRKLYFDTRLSKDGTVACATCHDVSRGFTDQRNVSEGIGDQLGRRNAPTVLNALFFQTQFLDGRSPTLEEQAKLPITNPIEMGMPDEASAVAAIEGDADYQAMFSAAYGRKPNIDDVGRAIAAFERTLVFLDSPFDRFLAGDAKAISDSAKRGWVLYNGKARCVSCHQINASSPIGTDNRFHNVGVSARHQNFEDLAAKALDALEGKEGKAEVQAIDELALETDLSELGRFLVTRNRADIGSFKTFQVRNVGVTAPYMHDGSMQTLWDVMDHYNKGGEANPFLDGGIEPLALTEAELDDVVELMFSMTDSRLAEDNAAQKAKQRAQSRKQRPFRDVAIAERKTFPFETRVGGKEK
jgi:cytochrome c peroxidase